MTLQIEEGKFYRTRGGWKVGPAKRHGVEGYPWKATYCYTDRGKFWSSGKEHEADIVAEWVDDPAPLKIEEGKCYWTLSGEKVGPLYYASEARCSWTDGRLCWYENGKYAVSYTHRWDIIGPVNDPIPSDVNDTVEQLAAEHDAEHAAYGALQGILDDAYAQAARGKGKERHANDKPFNDQPIMEVGRIVGSGFALGQVMKKAGEAKGMADRGEVGAAERELLGAIVYAAAAVLLIREGANAPTEG